MKPEPTFRLIDHHGNAVDDQSYRGRYALVFFGFTHCKVVCPRALTKLAAVLDALGPLAERVAPLYVTVDPERDTPAALRAFLAARDSRFTGLTGTREQIDEAKRAFRVFARRVADPSDPDGYSMPHTAITYLLDSTGRYAAHFADAVDEREMTERIRALLE